MKPAPLVIPALVYDAHEFSALAFGGIGAEQYCAGATHHAAAPFAVPLCIIGHARIMYNRYVEHDAGLYCAGANDDAVARINRRRGKPLSTRVSWRAYCAERNIIRGE